MVDSERSSGQILRRDFAAQYLRNCSDLPEFEGFYQDCPNARATSRELVLLPTHPRYPTAEIERNIGAIRGFYGSVPSGRVYG